ADTGTLFLDEIGELPLDLQAKLLRAIQERQIERLGGKSPIKVDIRIIAATNKDLDKEVASGKFRMDLYYRLHVFPIIVPPLRDRMQDISILTRHFLKHFSNLFGLTEEIKVAEKAMLQLTCHNWPGNIRELEHLMERNVLLAKDGVIDRFELANTNIFSANAKLGNDVKSMQENEADHILKVLKFCKGKLSGPGGAAELLKIPYSTLTSRMKKLGITKDSILHL
ncbi:MAG: sigma-54-dependent Fis family transcriptional regulator, partial [Chitinophagaceae bacterium]